MLLFKNNIYKVSMNNIILYFLFMRRMIMKKCKKCDLQIGIFQGYQHPILGKKQIVCRNCYNQIESLAGKWQEYVFANLDYINSLDICGGDLKNNFQEMVTSIMKGDFYTIMDENKKRSRPTFPTLPLAKVM